MWVIKASGPRSMTYFHYRPSRSAEVVRRLLAGYEGVVITDEYRGYDFLDRAAMGDTPYRGVVHAGC